MKFSSIVAIAPIIAMASALGINCRGSSNCDEVGDSGTLARLHSTVSQINSANFYSAGQHIACLSNICIFYQNNNGGTAGDAATHIQNLLNHGCTKCGSDPTTPGNNVDNGELTANWVSSP